MQQQSFNVPLQLPENFISIFLIVVYIIVIAYFLIFILNFFRDKFITKEANLKNPDYLELITILQKMFFVSGFGFVIANILQFLLLEMRGNRSNFVQFQGYWDYLTFGIILIFVGMGLKSGKKLVLKDRNLQ